MSVNIDTVEENIVSELRLSPIQSKVYVLVVKKGKMSAKDIAHDLNISEDAAHQVATSLIQNGGFIDITKTEFESMHPRFAIVNMYRRMCERENISFKKNLLVDNISIVLEKPYDDARTKYDQ
ncbi:MAG: helix-turn-helix domain-containing protein [Candidatus Nitrosotalea sp.]|nr:helix-turn-helix domain-containing protein [Candidatus Nitrosotalea sp.]